MRNKLRGATLSRCTVLQSSNTGIGLEVPVNWPAGADMLIMKSDDKQQNIFMLIEQMGADDLKQLLSQNIPPRCQHGTDTS